MKRKVRRIHWHTAENEKTNNSEVIRDQPFSLNEHVFRSFKHMSTSSLLEAKYCLGIGEKHFLLSRILLSISRDKRQIFRHARSGKVFKCRGIQRKNCLG